MVSVHLIPLDGGFLQEVTAWIHQTFIQRKELDFSHFEDSFFSHDGFYTRTIFTISLFYKRSMLFTYIINHMNCCYIIN